MFSSLAFYVSLLRKDFVNCCTQKLHDLGLTQGLLYFILYIGRHPGCSPHALAQALHMDSGHVARSIAKLEQGGFICQERSPSDKRSHQLTLLEKGEDAFMKSRDMFPQWDATVMDALSASEQTQLLALLQKLVQENNINDGGFLCRKE